ncbi:hypothetical protein JZ751_021843 [Albula glossodonta]|uniref:FHA domain-containing protein n=1 Tax=Albula glossodonta TaxID=121402 RepID=A0A8T2MTG1_9TELE|nr:hypothetical protein JZ751_021843 [Albula glossodonta]
MENSQCVQSPIQEERGQVVPTLEVNPRTDLQNTRQSAFIQGCNVVLEGHNLAPWRRTKDQEALRQLLSQVRIEWRRSVWRVRKIERESARLAGKPPPGLHLDVVKGDKLVEDLPSPHLILTLPFPQPLSSCERGGLDPHDCRVSCGAIVTAALRFKLRVAINKIPCSFVHLPYSYPPPTTFIHPLHSFLSLTKCPRSTKLIIDEKKYYLFGRNPDMCDFTIDHQSCSRVHAALVYHKHLKRLFLIDLNSTHGTFLGHIRLEPHKPQQVPIDSTVSFGASTRAYTIREKPQTQPSSGPGDSSKAGEEEEHRGLLGLPEEETELEREREREREGESVHAYGCNLTEFNTAHNKRISTLTIEEGNLDIQRPKRKRRNSRVTFNEDDEIINPEDVDPSVGRFRNMVQTAVVPMKKKKLEGHNALGLEDSGGRRLQSLSFGGGLYGDLPPSSHDAMPAGAQVGSTIMGGLPLPFPNPAPDVDLSPAVAQPPITLNPTPAPGPYAPETLNEPRKKKYAKEAWPGKKPTPSLLI